MNDVNKQGKYYSFPSKYSLIVEDRILREVEKSDLNGLYYLNLFNLNDRITEEAILNFYKSVPADSVAWNKSNYFSAHVKFTTYDRFEKAVKLGEPIIDGYKVCIRTSYYVNKEQIIKRRDEFYNNKRAGKDFRQPTHQSGYRKRDYYDQHDPHQGYGQDNREEDYDDNQYYPEAKTVHHKVTTPGERGGNEDYYDGAAEDSYRMHPSSNNYNRGYHSEKDYYGHHAPKDKSGYSSREDYYNYHEYDRHFYDRDSKHDRYDKSSKGYPSEDYGYDYHHRMQNYQNYQSDYNYGHAQDEYVGHQQSGYNKHRYDNYDYSGKHEDSYDYYQSGQDHYGYQQDKYNYSSNAFSKTKQSTKNRDYESNEQYQQQNHHRRTGNNPESKHYRDNNHQHFDKDSKSVKQTVKDTTGYNPKKKLEKPPKEDNNAYYYGHQEDDQTIRKNKAKSKEENHEHDAYDYFTQNDQPKAPNASQKPTDDKNQPQRRKEYDSTGGSSAMVYDYMKDSNHPYPNRTGQQVSIGGPGVFLAESGVQRDPASFLGEYDYMGSKKEHPKHEDTVKVIDSKLNAEQEVKHFKAEPYYNTQREKQLGTIYTEKPAAPLKVGGAQPQLASNKAELYQNLQPNERFAQKPTPAMKPSPVVVNSQPAHSSKPQNQPQQQYSYYGATANEIALKYSEKAGSIDESGTGVSKTISIPTPEQSKKASEPESDWGRRKFFNKVKGAEASLTKATHVRDGQQ